MEKYSALQYRKAADRVWEMAREYEANGEKELAEVFKEVADRLHNLAREKEGSSSLPPRE